jgi:hypothetical protein
MNIIYLCLLCSKARNKAKTFQWHSHLLSLNLDTYGLKFIKDFSILIFANTQKIGSSFLIKKSFNSFFIVTFLRDHNSNKRSDNKHRINVLP